MKVVAQAGVVAPGVRARPVGGLGFDWASVILASWMIGGLYLDGWAHTHQAGLETFFTPWHAVLYSGFLAQAGLLAGTLLLNHQRGRSWSTAMPEGYVPSLLGAAIFLLGGLGDMVWHTIFGIEVNIDALLSPTHLALAFGGALMLLGPLRAAAHRPAGEAARGAALWPAVLALAGLLALLNFFSEYIHPFAHTWAAGTRPYSGQLVFFTQALGVGGILLQAAVLTAILLVALRRWGTALPAATCTLILGLSTALLVVIADRQLALAPWRLIVVGGLAGLAADGVRWWLRPAATRPASVRVFAFLAPAILYGLYFAALALAGPIWWSVHMWAGAVVLAGLAGWLVSYLVVPGAGLAAPHSPLGHAE